MKDLLSVHALHYSAMKLIRERILDFICKCVK